MIRVYILGLFFCSAIISCKKKGCTDFLAFNYFEENLEDDGSCTYIKKMIINSISAQIISSTDSNGEKWDADGLPDCQIRMSYGYNNTSNSWQSEVYQEMPLGLYHEFNLDEPIIVDMDSITASKKWFINLSLIDIDLTEDTTILVPRFQLERAANGRLIGSNLSGYNKRIVVIDPGFYGQNEDSNKYANVVMNVEWVTE